MIRIESLPRRKGVTEAQRRAKAAAANALFAPRVAGPAIDFQQAHGTEVNPSGDTTLSSLYTAKRSTTDVAQRRREDKLAALTPAAQAYEAPLTLFERQVLDQVHRAQLRYGTGNWFTLHPADISAALKDGTTPDMVRQAMAKLVALGVVGQRQSFTSFLPG